LCPGVYPTPGHFFISQCVAKSQVVALTATGVGPYPTFGHGGVRHPTPSGSTRCPTPWPRFPCVASAGRRYSEALRNRRLMHDARNAELKVAPAQERPGGWQRWLHQNRGRLAAPIVLMLLILLWAALVAWQEYPPFILPSPALVWRKFLSVAGDGSIWLHVSVTLLEIALGLAVGLSAAFSLGYLLGKHRSLERIASPYIVASQSIPIVAIAPLIVIWMGSGLASKVAVTALITFFPVLIATIVGIRNVDADLHDL